MKRLSITIDSFFKNDNKRQFFALTDTIKQHILIIENKESQDFKNGIILLAIIYLYQEKFNDADTIINLGIQHNTLSQELLYHETLHHFITKQNNFHLTKKIIRYIHKKYPNNINILSQYLHFLSEHHKHKYVIALAHQNQDFYCDRNFSMAKRIIAKSYQALDNTRLYHQWLRFAAADMYADYIGLNDLALYHRDHLRYTESRHYFYRPLNAQKSDGLYIKNKGLSDLVNGDFANGWKKYNHRFDSQDYSLNTMPFDLDVWQGEDLNHKSIIILCEQGYGDNIQLFRFIKHMCDKYPHAHIAVTGWKNLYDLFYDNLPQVMWIEFPKTQPHYDYQVPIFNLPDILHITIDNIPYTKSYLKAPKKFLEKWYDILLPYQQKKYQKNYVICWQTSHENPHNALHAKTRSVPLSSLKRLLELPNITFHLINPTKYDDRDDVGKYTIIDHRPMIDNFADCAAIISLCDGVITIDTALAHLAGALGKNTALMLPLIPDWRWLLKRRHSPWYQSVRLYRQKTKIGFDDIITQITYDINADFFINHNITSYPDKAIISNIKKHIEKQNFIQARLDILQYLLFLKKYHQQYHPDIITVLYMLRSIIAYTGDISCLIEEIDDLITQFGYHDKIIFILLPILLQYHYHEDIASLCQHISAKNKYIAYDYWHYLSYHHLILKHITYDKLPYQDNNDIKYYINAVSYQIFSLKKYKLSLPYHKDKIWQLFAHYMRDMKDNKSFTALYHYITSQKEASLDIYHISQLINKIIITHQIKNYTLINVKPNESSFIWKNMLNKPYKPIEKWTKNDTILIKYDILNDNLMACLPFLYHLSQKIDKFYILHHEFICNDLNALFGNEKIFFINNNIIYDYIKQIDNHIYLCDLLNYFDDISGIKPLSLPLSSIDAKISLSAFQPRNAIFDIAIYIDDGYHFVNKEWAYQPSLYNIESLISQIYKSYQDIIEYFNIHLLNVNPSTDERIMIQKCQQSYPCHIYDHSLSCNHLYDMLYIAQQCHIIITIDSTIGHILSLLNKATIILQHPYSYNYSIGQFFNIHQHNSIMIDTMPELKQQFDLMYHRHFIDFAHRYSENTVMSMIDNHYEAVNSDNIKNMFQKLEKAIIPISNNTQNARFYNIYAAFEQSCHHDDVANNYYKISLNYEETAICYRNHAVNVGNSGQTNSAISLMKKALALDPTISNANRNLGYYYCDLGDYEASLEYFKQEYAIGDKTRDDICNLAVAYLKLQYFDEGFGFYKLMRQLYRDDKYRPKTDKPLWQGENLEGKYLLIQSEQGYGDNIMYSRFINNVKKLGAHIIFVCYENLYLLYKDNPVIDDIIIRDKDSLPYHDYWVMMIDLLIDHYQRFKKFTPQACYITPHQERIEYWQQKINYIAPYPQNRARNGKKKQLRIGICWASQNFPPEQKRRALPLNDIKKLINIKDHYLIAFQVGDRESDFNDPAFNHVHNLAPELYNFEETAAAMLQCDLIISVDTACAHIASAIGQKTWLLLPVGCDWRYLELDRNGYKNLWYSNMRIFRQKELHNWSHPINAVKRALKRLS